MKRFTLLFLAVIASVASFAQNESAKALFSQLRAQRAAKVSQLSSLQKAEPRTTSAFSRRISATPRLNVQKAKRANAYQDGKFSYAFSTSYEYIDGVGLTTVPLDTTIVYSKASKDSIFVDLLSKGLGFIGAKILPSSIEGVDSLVFAPGQVVGSLKDGTKLAIYGATPKVLSRAVIFTKNDDPISAYYDPESGTIVSNGDAAWGVYAGDDATEPIDTCYRMYFSTVGLVDDFTSYSGTRTLTYTENGVSKTDSKSIDAIIMSSQDDEGNDVTNVYVRNLSYAASEFGDWQSLTLDEGDDGDAPMLHFIGSQYLANSGLTPYYSMPGDLSYNLKDSLSFVGTFNNDSTQLTFTPKSDSDCMFDLIYSEGELGLAFYPETITSFTINFPKESTGIRGIKTGATGVVREEYFDMTGRRVDSAYKGLVIRRTVDASGNATVRKLIR